MGFAKEAVLFQAIPEVGSFQGYLFSSKHMLMQEHSERSTACKYPLVNPLQAISFQSGHQWDYSEESALRIAARKPTARLGLSQAPQTIPSHVVIHPEIPICLKAIKA